MRSALLLNADYAPMSVISARRAVSMIVADEAISLDDSDVLFRSQKVSVNVPYVLIARKYKRIKNGVRTAKFSRKGVLLRDNYTCIYCSQAATTIDHVVPRKSGGATSYDNCVAACLRCNGKKGHKSLKQMNWTIPDNVMTTPTLLHSMLASVATNKEHFDAWSPYVFLFEPKLAQAFEQKV